MRSVSRIVFSYAHTSFRNWKACSPDCNSSCLCRDDSHDSRGSTRVNCPVCNPNCASLRAAKLLADLCAKLSKGEPSPCPDQFSPPGLGIFPGHGKLNWADVTGGAAPTLAQAVAEDALLNDSGFSTVLGVRRTGSVRAFLRRTVADLADGQTLALNVCCTAQAHRSGRLSEVFRVPVWTTSENEKKRGVTQRRQAVDLRQGVQAGRRKRRVALHRWVLARRPGLGR